MLPFADLAIRKDRYFLHREGSAMPDLHSSFNWVVIMKSWQRAQRHRHSIYCPSWQVSTIACRLPSRGLII